MDRQTDGSMLPPPGWHLGQVLEGVEVEGRIKEPLQLRQVGFLVAGSRGSRRLSPCIPAGEKVGGEEWSAPHRAPPQHHGNPPSPYHTGLARLMVVRSRGLT